MTTDQLLAVVLWGVAGLYIGARLNYLRRDLNMVSRSTAAGEDALRSEVAHLRAAVAELSANERTNALDICRIGDAYSETAREVLAQARALDAHDERLQGLERDTTDLNAAHFKTATTVEDHGERLDYVERHVPDPS